MSAQMINYQASIRSPLDLRNKELESEISKVQTSQDGIKRELEKYVRLCQEEMEHRKLLENKLTDFHRMKERLAELSTELLEKQMNRLLLSKRNTTPRGNLDSATSRPCSSTTAGMQTSVSMPSTSLSMPASVRLPLDPQHLKPGH